MLPILGMLSLIVAKALVGHEEIKPYEAAFEALEITAVFIAGMHAAHHLKKGEH